MSVNWMRLMADLKRAGWTLRSIGAATGLKKDRLHHIAHGAEPLHCHGEALLELHGRRSEPRKENLTVADIRQVYPETVSNDLLLLGRKIRPDEDEETPESGIAT